MTQRMNRDDRKAWLIEQATDLAAKIGYSNLTRELLCAHAGVSRALINQYFPGGIGEVKDGVVSHAVSVRNYRVLAEAVLFKHPGVSRIKAKIRDEVVDVMYPAKK